MLLRYLEKGYKNGRVYQKTEMGPKEIKKKKKYNGRVLYMFEEY